MNTPKQARKIAKGWERTKVRFLPPDHKPVRGNCVGVVGRAYLGHAAGYEDAHSLIAACRAKGVLRKGRPGLGDILLWHGGSHGHAALRGRIWIPLHRIVLGADMPNVGLVGHARKSRIHKDWGYVYAGFVKATDIPGWK